MEDEQEKKRKEEIEIMKQRPSSYYEYELKGNYIYLFIEFIH